MELAVQPVRYTQQKEQEVSVDEMAYRCRFHVGIIGSLSKCSAIAIDRDGSPVWVEQQQGLQFRELPNADFGLRLDNLLLTLARALDTGIKQLAEQTAVVAAAFCGVDPRHRSSIQKLTANLNNSGFAWDRINVCSVPNATHSGAFLNKTGVLVRSGAGSSVFGMVSGSEPGCLSLGLGTLAYDAGSVYAMGQRVLPLLWESVEGYADRKSKRFIDGILPHLSLARPEDFFQSVDNIPRDVLLQKICEVGEATIALRDEEDTVARHIVTSELEILSNAVQRTANRLKICETGFELALAGGLFEKVPSVINELLILIQSKCAKSRPSPGNGVHNRTVGIGLLALKNADEGLRNRFLTRVDGHMLPEVTIP